MGHIPHLDQIALVVGAGVIAALVLARLGLPTVAGLLVAGALVGPHALGLVKEVEPIEALAEVGVVLLLFTIGLEFSLTRLRFIARQVMIGGSLQVGLTIVCVLVVTLVAGQGASRGIFLGFLFALSSTAIVLRALSERGELDAPHGRLIVGALIFQDLCVVPMMLVVPILAGRGGGSILVSVALALGKAAAVVIAAVAVARVVVPRLFARVDASRSRDVFLLAVLGVCVGTAFLTSLAGLSMALGAFLAGVILADTDYGNRALSEVLPLRDLFASLFFISLGMLFDIRALLERPMLVGVLLGGFVVGKGFVATIAALGMRFPARVAWLVGVGLAQFGEFGFVLVREGQKLGIIGPDQARALLAAGVISMFLTPLAVRVAPHVSAGEKLLAPLEKLLRVRGMDEPAPEHQAFSDHVVIAGYGLGGRLLARALVESGVRYLILELNAEAVRQGRSEGQPIYYGDITSAEALHHARIEHARAFVLLINDRDAARRAVAAARHHAPRIAVFLRTRYLTDAGELLAIGARDVVSEELEAAMEMMARVLRQVGLPRNLISARLADARSETQASQRRATMPRLRFGSVPELADLKVESFLVNAADQAAGRSIADLKLRTRTGALVVAVSRGGVLLDHPDPRQPLQEGDLVFLVGPGASIRKAIDALGAGASEGSAGKIKV